MKTELGLWIMHMLDVCSTSTSTRTRCIYIYIDLYYIYIAAYIYIYIYISSLSNHVGTHNMQLEISIKNPRAVSHDEAFTLGNETLARMS